MSDGNLTEHARRNRVAWDALAADYVASGERKWASDEPCWGVWRVGERELRVLPDVTGLDAIELGCGTAYWSAWLARRGARPVGIDNSERQLEVRQGRTTRLLRARGDAQMHPRRAHLHTAAPPAAGLAAEKASGPGIVFTEWPFPAAGPGAAGAAGLPRAPARGPEARPAGPARGPAYA